MPTSPAARACLALALALSPALFVACSSSSPQVSNEPLVPTAGAPSGSAPADAKGDKKADADAKGDAKADAKGDAKADAKGDAKADAKGDAKTDAKGDAKAGSANKSDKLEDAVGKKTTSAGGSYTVRVLSASGVEQKAVSDALNAASGKTDPCFASLFKKQLSAKGKMVYDLTIAAGGKGKDLKLKEDEIKAADVSKCLDGALKGITYPAPEKGKTAQVTVEVTVTGN